MWKCPFEKLSFRNTETAGSHTDILKHSSCIFYLFTCEISVFQPKKGGGLSYNSTVPLTHCSEKLVQLILHEYSILLPSLVTLFNFPLMISDTSTLTWLQKSSMLRFCSERTALQMSLLMSLWATEYTCLAYMWVYIYFNSSISLMQSFSDWKVCWQIWKWLLIINLITGVQQSGSDFYRGSGSSGS